MNSCFKAADILLPAAEADASKWAVVACDQYTSEPEYWEEAAKIAGDAPSALNIVYPEVYLEEGDSRIAKIQGYMKKYLEEGILTERVHQGFVLTSRVTETGNRIGLVGVVDLDSYDFTPGTSAPIRATEGTIQSRIPPRMKIREGAPVESPHVMLLVDDPEFSLIEPLFDKKDEFRELYNTELMLNGGHLSGYAIEGAAAEKLGEQIAQMEAAGNGFFLAVGDGNHSLATAKACWEKIKQSLSEEECAMHPAKYALVEVVNLHSPALVFEPIHRVLFGAGIEELVTEFKAELTKLNMAAENGAEVVFVNGAARVSMSISGKNGRLPVDILQSFLDDYIAKNDNVKIDYIHGEDSVNKLSAEAGNCGILLGAIDKNMLFPAIIAGGVLPRKTFSMGEAYEKRYYMECRRIG